MKVLLAILNAAVARGGAERYTRDLAAAFLGRGMEVATAAVSFDGDWPGRKIEVGARAVTRAGVYSRYLGQLDRVIDEEGAGGAGSGGGGGGWDIVHAMLPVKRCDLYHPHAGIAAETKRWGPFEHLNRRRRGMLLAERDLLIAADPPVTLSLSNYVLGRFRAVYPGAPSEVVLNGVDTGRFDPEAARGMRAGVRKAWGILEGEKVILCVAQDFARKGVPVAVEAMAKLRDLPVKLVVVGRDDPEPVLAVAKGLGVEGKVVLPGAMGDTRGAYAGADLFTLPTYHDPCSLVVIEALAMGLPVISTVFNGSCEWMKDGVHGRILPEVDAGMLAGAFRELLVDEGRREAAARACLGLRGVLSAEHHVSRVLQVYEKARLERVR